MRLAGKFDARELVRISDGLLDVLDDSALGLSAFERGVVREALITINDLRGVLDEGTLDGR
ncbi:MAG: hypothetical protein ACE5EI_09360 [Thermodesulfobacteriota bacterium]